MITQIQKKLIDERVNEVVGDGKHTLRSILTNLFIHAQPGNKAFYELEDKWGFTGDYTNHDQGNEINHNDHE